MSGYDFLEGVIVIEVAQLGMNSLGGHLADMGARVVKVEAVPGGDPVRFSGEYAVGGPEGVGYLHLRWNRGKDSIGLDLRTPEGADLFRQLAAKADIVIDGLKGGALDRLGLGYDALQADNRDLVYCSISGLGTTGPYHRLRSHASAYDAYAGLTPKQLPEQPPARHEFKSPSVGMNVPGLYAAIGVLASLHRARTSGVGACIEVAAIDAAASFGPDTLDATLNGALTIERDGFLDATGRMRDWPRLWYYETSDGRTLHLQALAEPTWARFCRAVQREDLLDLGERGHDDAEYNSVLKKEIADIIGTRSLADWMNLFIERDISAVPLNDLTEVTQDENFIERRSWYEVDMPGTGRLRLCSTPVRVSGQAFSPAIAPAMGEHSDLILGDLLQMDAAAISGLRANGIIA